MFPPRQDDKMAGGPLLVFANKQDLATAEQARPDPDSIVTPGL